MRSLLALCAITALVSACASGDDPVESEQAPVEDSVTLGLEVPELNTFVNKSVQIDELGGGPGDANLTVGPDADGSASADLPTGGPLPFIDWNDFAGDLANHRLLDLDSGKHGDPTSFPLSNECVGQSQVLSKMDLVYVASANNNEYAYLAVARSSNSGDAGYYWLFTKKEPHQILGGGKCSANKGHRQLLYDITGPDSEGNGGDVLVRGHFKPSADDPLLTVYRATQDANNVTAYDAVNYLGGLWAEDPSGVAAVAVNTTPMGPGALGSAGVKNMDGANLDTELFAEAAVPLSVFTSGSVCDATFFGSIITRSSGSGGTTPDLKDLAGPALFNFGTATATAIMTPTCGLDAGYQVTSATGADGQPIVDPVCKWTFSNGDIRNDCSGTKDFPSADAYGATLEVTDPASNCTATVDVASVNLYPPLNVDPTMNATCDSSFSYNSTVTGGSPAGVSYSWGFTANGGTATPTDATAASGTATVSQGGIEYTGTVTVTDLRDDGLNCTDTDSASATPYDPIVVSLSLAAEPQTCPSMTTDGVTYVASVSGGTGNYAYTWADPGCTGISCLVNPADDDYCAGPTQVQVVVGDDSGICDEQPSEIEVYRKTTIVTATDN